MSPRLMTLSALALLAACGSGGSPTAPAPAPAPTPAPQVDALVRYIEPLARVPLDDAEPQAVDAAPQSAPDDTDPVAL